MNICYVCKKITFNLQSINALDLKIPLCNNCNMPEEDDCVLRMALSIYLSDFNTKDKNYISFLKNINLECSEVSCTKLGNELHHLVNLTKRYDYLVIPLCTDHHRGNNSIHRNSKDFINKNSLYYLYIIALSFYKRYNESI